MRYLFFRWMLTGLMLVMFFPVPAASQTINIEGTYTLFREGDMSGTVVGCMRISNQIATRFSIGIAHRTGNPAMDWQGNGEIKGNSGIYFWVFDDGKQGHTTFTVDNAGNIHGHVQGPGINWKYVARRQ